MENPGPLAARGYLQVLGKGEPVKFHDGSGRAELAAMIADVANPLTARVMVNRVWDLLFGRPLARTTSNFGAMGEKPTHPELLDDLAVRFVRGGWSVKKLIRELVLSATYRQESGAQSAESGEMTDKSASALAALRPALFACMERRRLSVEQFRDAVLAVAGKLDTTGGQSANLDDAGNDRRTVYARVSRRELNKTLMLFDYPDANVHAARRSSSTTPTQKLFVLNSPFMIEQSKQLAKRLSALKGDDASRVRFAYKLLYSREAEPMEVRFALDFLQATSGDKTMTNWDQLAQALLATNEMLYVD